MSGRRSGTVKRAPPAGPASPTPAAASSPKSRGGKRNKKQKIAHAGAGAGAAFTAAAVEQKEREEDEEGDAQMHAAASSSSSAAAASSSSSAAASQPCYFRSVSHGDLAACIAHCLTLPDLHRWACVNRDGRAAVNHKLSHCGLLNLALSPRCGDSVFEQLCDRIRGIEVLLLPYEHLQIIWRAPDDGSNRPRFTGRPGVSHLLRLLDANASTLRVLSFDESQPAPRFQSHELQIDSFVETLVERQHLWPKLRVTPHPIFQTRIETAQRMLLQRIARREGTPSAQPVPPLLEMYLPVKPPTPPPTPLPKKKTRAARRKRAKKGGAAAAAAAAAAEEEEDAEAEPEIAAAAAGGGAAMAPMELQQPVPMLDETVAASAVAASSSADAAAAPSSAASSSSPPVPLADLLHLSIELPIDWLDRLVESLPALEVLHIEVFARGTRRSEDADQDWPAVDQMPGIEDVRIIERMCVKLSHLLVLWLQFSSPLPRSSKIHLHCPLLLQLLICDDETHRTLSDISFDCPRLISANITCRLLPAVPSESPEADDAVSARIPPSLLQSLDRSPSLRAMHISRLKKASGIAETCFDYLTLAQKESINAKSIKAGKRALFLPSGACVAGVNNQIRAFIYSLGELSFARELQCIEDCPSVVSLEECVELFPGLRGCCLVPLYTESPSWFRPPPHLDPMNLEHVRLWLQQGVLRSWDRIQSHRGLLHAGKELQEVDDFSARMQREKPTVPAWATVAENVALSTALGNRILVQQDSFFRQLSVVYLCAPTQVSPAFLQTLLHECAQLQSLSLIQLPNVGNALFLELPAGFTRPSLRTLRLKSPCDDLTVKHRRARAHRFFSFDIAEKLALAFPSLRHLELLVTQQEPPLDLFHPLRDLWYAAEIQHAEQQDARVAAASSHGRSKAAASSAAAAAAAPSSSASSAASSVSLYPFPFLTTLVVNYVPPEVEPEVYSDPPAQELADAWRARASQLWRDPGSDLPMIPFVPQVITIDVVNVCWQKQTRESSSSDWMMQGRRILSEEAEPPFYSVLPPGSIRCVTRESQESACFKEHCPSQHHGGLQIVHGYE